MSALESMPINDITIREVVTFEEMDRCLELQREVFSFSDLDVSPRRHLVVTRQSGGFTLGAYDGEVIVGLAITMPALLGDKKAFYSHMAGVKTEYQSLGIGGKLKWAQRERALAENVKFIKWTFQPVQSRNAFFNLERLGVHIKEIIPNFYGTGFSNIGAKTELESDRVYAEWELECEKVITLLQGNEFIETRPVAGTILATKDWNALIEEDVKAAEIEQNRIRTEFQTHFKNGLICDGFRRNEDSSEFLFFEKS